MLLRVVVPLLLVLLTTHAVVCALPNWRGCVLGLESYFETPSFNVSRWSKEGSDRCGYSSLTGDRLLTTDLLKERTITFIGDSTAIRMFVYTVNRLAQDPSDRMAYGKVADAPVRLSKTLRITTADGTTFTTTIRFFRMMFISTAEVVFTEAIGSHPAGTSRGLIFVTAGNWDLNWKLQLKQPMPGLTGPVHNWPVAQEYWTKYVDRMFTVIASSLEQLPAESRPVVIYREQYLPNCAASRFSDKKRRYRKCGSLIRPVVIPFYRRTLLRVAWSMEIPVVPGFIADRRECSISDGLHLDFPCMAFEQELLWNVGRLVLGPAKGLPPRQGSSGRDVPRSVDYGLNRTRFAEWYVDFAKRNGVAPKGVDVAIASVAPSSVPEEDTDTPETQASPPGSPPPPPPAPVPAETEVTTKPASPTVPTEVPDPTSLRPRSPRARIGWSEVGTHLLVAVAVLIVLAAPLWWIFR